MNSPSSGACGQCGRDPADGWAMINEVRYCHGDGAGPTCYERQVLGGDPSRWIRTTREG